MRHGRIVDDIDRALQRRGIAHAVVHDEDVIEVDRKGFFGRRPTRSRRRMVNAVIECEGVVAARIDREREDNAVAAVEPGAIPPIDVADHLVRRDLMIKNGRAARRKRAAADLLDLRVFQRTVELEVIGAVTAAHEERAGLYVGDVAEAARAGVRVETGRVIRILVA